MTEGSVRSPTTSIELDISGMSCASCAARIEKRLNALDGVRATVNYATEKATVEYGLAVTTEDLLSTVAKAGYEASRPAGEAAEEPSASPGRDRQPALGRRLVVSASLTVPLMVISMVPLGMDWGWVALALAAPVALWGAWPFHRAAWTNLKHRATTMDTLVSLGVLAAFSWSGYALVAGEEPYFEVAGVVTTFLLAGRFLEARAKRRAGAAVRSLLELGAKDVAVLRDGVEHRVPIGELAVGDRFLVRPGEQVATDGLVLEGASALDTAVLTGESVPVEVGPADVVVGGSVNAGGRLVVRATRVGAETQLAQLARLVSQAQAGKARVQRLADRVSAVFVPVVLVVAGLTLAGWLVAGEDAAAAIRAAVAVLIIACPCALGLATPTALLVGSGRGAQLGIVIKGPEALEATRQVDTVVLDKTGTVTAGSMELIDVIPASGQTSDAVLRWAGAVESASEHPIAAAIASAAVRRLGPLASVSDFSATAGLGVQGVVEGHRVLVGRRGLVAATHGALPADLEQAAAAAEAAGRTAVVLSVDDRACGVLVVADPVKPTAAEAVQQLRALGLRPLLLSGDAEPVALAVAAQVGIEADDVLAGVLPAEKVAAIRRLQQSGAVVAMVGDGVNDAAALAQADLGLAMGTGTDVAIAASDLTLMRGDLLAVVDAIRLARRTLRTIQGNLFWAFAYNVAAIPLAAAGLLNPMIAGAAMALSSLFVVTNSLRLSRFASARPRSGSVVGPASSRAPVGASARR